MTKLKLEGDVDTQFVSRWQTRSHLCLRKTKSFCITRLDNWLKKTPTTFSANRKLNQNCGSLAHTSMRYVYLLRVLIGLLDRLWLCPLWVAIVISSVLVLKLRPNDRNISQHNISQHRWLSICKLRPNGRKHIATLLAATCCARSATLLRRVAACWVLKIEQVRMPGRITVAMTWPNDYTIMQHSQKLHENLAIFKFQPTTPTCRNSSQQGCQTRATCYAH